MKRTASSQIPPEAEIGSLLKKWRAKALIMLLLVVLVSGFPAYALVLVNAIRYGQWTPLIVIYMACYLATAGLLFWARLDYRLRVWGLIGLCLVNAAASFGRLGLFGSGRLWLVVLPIIAAILLGTRGGFITAFCALALYAGFVGLVHFRMLGNWIVPSLDPLALGFWIEAGAALIVFIPTMVVLIQRYVRLHNQTLTEVNHANAELKRLSGNLSESEERYRVLVEASSEAMFLRDSEGTIVYVNPAALNLLHFKRPQDLLGKQYLELVHPDDRPDSIKRIERSMEEGLTAPRRAHRLISRDGQVIQVESTGLPVMYQRRQHLLGVFRDITEQKVAEEALRASEQEARKSAQELEVMLRIGQVISSSLVIDDVYEPFVGEVRKLVEFDRLTINIVNLREGYFSLKYVSGSEVPGRQRGENIPLNGSLNAEVVRKKHPLLIQGSSWEKALVDFPRLLPLYEAGLRSIVMVPLISKDQAIGVMTLMSSKPEAYAERDQKMAARVGLQIGGAIANAQLYSEWKKTEEELRKSEMYNRTLVEAASQAKEGVIVIQDEAAREAGIAFANEAVLRLTGYDPLELQRLSWFDLISPKDRQTAKDRYRKRLCGEAIKDSLEISLTRKNGREFPIEVSASMTQFNAKPATVGFFRDISDRKKAEAQLILSERCLREIIDLVPHLIFAKDRDGRYTLVNQAMADFYGTTVEGLIGKSEIEIGQPEDEVLHWRNDDLEVIRSGNRKMIPEEHVTDPSGRIRSVSTVKIPFTFAGSQSPSVLAISVDITDLKRMEKTLRESEERYRRLVENAPLGIVFIDPDGNIKQVNSQLVSILGSPSAEATREINLFQFPALKEAGVSDHFRRCLETGTSGVFETRYRSKWGKDSYLRYLLSPIRDPEDRIAGVQAVVEDVSERRQLEEQLLQAQKMEAIGTLAGGIAHDFNNILAAIMGYAELASLDLEEGTKTRYNLQQSIRASYRAKDLVQQILAFSRQGRQERRPLDIGPIVKEGLKLLRASLPATIEIQQEVARDLGTIEADPTQIHQVLMNLCTNAGHAMEERGGILGVFLKKVDVDGEVIAVSGRVEPGHYLRLRVRDTGQGMAPEVLKRIFDPYFTTKGPGKGTGLGLAVVHGIVQGYRGRIVVESAPGKGTTFDIYFPQVDMGVAPTEKEKVEPLPLGGQERVLFVDDEQAIVEIGQKILGYLGYQVIVRTSSLEALELFRANPERFDLVITDLTMPNLTGDRLAQELLRIRPEIPIILCTGFSESMSEEKAKALGVREFVMKPLVMKELAKATRRSLNHVQKGKKE